MYFRSQKYDFFSNYYCFCKEIAHPYGNFATEKNKEL